MTKRLGAILCLLLGSILIAGGLGGTADSTAGGTVPRCDVQVNGLVFPCPLGTISITKVVSGTGTAPAGGWVVTVTSSNCALPVTSSNTVTLPAAGGTVATQPLFLFTDSTHTTACAYSLTETAVAGFTPSFLPAGPYTIPLAASVLSVTLTNTADVTSSTPPVSTSPVSTPPVSTPATSTPAPTVTASAALATTGTSHVRPTFFVGIALCLLGVVLLFSGRRPRGARQ